MTRQNTRQKKERMTKVTSIFVPGLQRMADERTLEPVLSNIMAEQKTSEDKSAAFRMLAEIGEKVQDTVDLYTDTLWGIVAEKADIWRHVGGEVKFKEEQRYTETAEPRRVRLQTKKTRKANARVTLSEAWGGVWERGFDTRQQRLKDPAEHVLQGLAAMAKKGWPQKVVWLAMDLAYRTRIQEQRHNTNTFVRNDVETCKQWLAALEENGKEMSHVVLADLMGVLPEEMRRHEAGRAERRTQQMEPAASGSIRSGSPETPLPIPHSVSQPVSSSVSPPRSETETVDEAERDEKENKEEGESVLIDDIRDPKYRLVWDFQIQRVVSIDQRYPPQPVRLVGGAVKHVWNWGFDPTRFAVNVDTGELALVGGTIQEVVDEVETERQAEEEVEKQVEEMAVKEASAQMVEMETEEETGERTEEQAKGKTQASSEHGTLQQSPVATASKKRKRAIQTNTQEEIRRSTREGRGKKRV